MVALVQTMAKDIHVLVKLIFMAIDVNFVNLFYYGLKFAFIYFKIYMYIKLMHVITSHVKMEALVLHMKMHMCVHVHQVIVEQTVNNKQMQLSTG